MKTAAGCLVQALTLIALAVWLAVAAGAGFAIAVRTFELFMGGPR